MREYEPIWIALKTSTKLEIRISLHPAYHKRVIKAVTKEKWMDEAFKYECLNPTDKSITPHRMELLYKIEGSIITFRLKKIISVKNVEVDNI